MLTKKRLSSKINYEVLEKLFDDSEGKHDLQVSGQKWQKRRMKNRLLLRTRRKSVLNQIMKMMIMGSKSAKNQVRKLYQMWWITMLISGRTTMKKGMVMACIMEMKRMDMVMMMNIDLKLNSFYVYILIHLEVEPEVFEDYAL
ncbi:uncharacterized protein LOC122057704 isoform X1 [Macadamia integrifolia]|uniref:uncharacterized protein LOC122057704 isoform X1 n=1 Tax=Macadamia integrifolia TaxID=60698 RepID=UPI001C52F0A6|nr:uncharacterized protein LOC122057704 isoform X1 [Macadamia integrifolia]